MLLPRRPIWEVDPFRPVPGRVPADDHLHPEGLPKPVEAQELRGTEAVGAPLLLHEDAPLRQVGPAALYGERRPLLGPVVYQAAGIPVARQRGLGGAPRLVLLGGLVYLHVRKAPIMAQAASGRKCAIGTIPG